MQGKSLSLKSIFPQIALQAYILPNIYSTFDSDFNMYPIYY